MSVWICNITSSRQTIIAFLIYIPCVDGFVMSDNCLCAKQTIVLSSTSFMEFITAAQHYAAVMYSPTYSVCNILAKQITNKLNTEMLITSRTQ